MTPAHTDSPLRRSEAGIFREPGAQNPQPVHNDDEEERRTLRRTLLSSSAGETTDASTVEQNENLKKYLEIYCENKLNAKNAWTFGVIDTVAALLERHHKSLNNFTVAGSSLEMSSKVYGMRVDSVHTDVLRMSAGLNARKFRENANEEDDDGVATGGEGNADPNSSANTGIETARTGKRKKQRKKAGATVTKNKETLNARLDTVPMQDPVFGKLNTTVGSINASNRLMNNMLNTVEGELRLRTTHKFWNADDHHDDDEDIDYTDPVAFENMPNQKLLPCERLNRVERFEQLLLRPTNSGYIISDMPITVTDDQTGNIPPYNDDMPDGDSSPAVGLFDNCADPMMAFDMNAECEPLPQLDTYAPILDIGEHDDYTVEEHNALGNVRGLRKSAIVIEDMRPVDSTTSLEYSYRPVEKISQFWAGPSHWRFRRNTHHQRSTMGQNGAFGNAQTEANGRRQTKTKGRKRDAGLQGKKRTRIEFAAPVHDNLFIKLDAKYKLRRMNFQKKWDQKKLRLPEDLHLNAHDLVNTRCFAPAFAIFDDNSHALEDVNVAESESIAPTPLEDEHFMADDGGGDEHAAGAVGGDVDLFDALQESMLAPGETQNASNNENPANLSNTDVRDNVPGEEDKANETVLEIATEYEGAPSQVTKIIVPFAKRAKVIDMKNLKRTCTTLISNQLKATAETINESQMPAHPTQKNEHYAPGIASFREVYKKLPNLLPPAMAEGLSPSIAFYSVLHLANDFNYRLIPQEDLEDFSIRQVLDE